MNRLRTAISLGCALVAATALAGGTDSAMPLFVHMAEYNNTLQGARNALLRNDDAALRATLNQLVAMNRPDQLPEAWRGAYTGQRIDAALAAGAVDRRQAAALLTHIAESCGGCHAAQGRGPRFTAPPRPEPMGGLDDHMLEHRWALDRLWEGLVQPSDEAWAAGIAMLNEPGVVSGLEAGDPSSPPPVAIEQLLHQLAGLASEGVAPEKRSDTYLSVSTICSDCHLQSKRAPR